jgi:hypothetical protein
MGGGKRKSKRKRGGDWCRKRSPQGGRERSVSRDQPSLTATQPQEILLGSKNEIIVFLLPCNMQMTPFSC